MGGDSGGRLHAFRSLAGNQALVRVLAGYAMFVLTEYSAWIAMLVFAYSHGGATVAGIVAVAQLVPGAVLAPVMAAVADRRSPVMLLAGGYLVQAAGMAAAAAAVFAGVPVAVYVSAVIACVAQTTVRPTQSALVPLVATTADQLTAVNVVVSWLESAGMLTSGLLAGLLIALSGVGSVFVVCAGLGVVAMLLAAGLRVPLAPPPEGSPAVLADVAEGLRLAARQPRLRVMLTLLTAESVVAGALDLLFVILAVSVLGRSEAWAGYLNSAYGTGAFRQTIRRQGITLYAPLKETNDANATTLLATGTFQFHGDHLICPADQASFKSSAAGFTYLKCREVTHPNLLRASAKSRYGLPKALGPDSR